MTPATTIPELLKIKGKAGVDFDFYDGNSRDDAGPAYEVIFFNEKRADAERKRLPVMFRGRRLIVSCHSIGLNTENSKELDAIVPSTTFEGDF